MMACSLERINLAVVKYMVDRILELHQHSYSSMTLVYNGVYQKSRTAVLDGRNELHL